MSTPVIRTKDLHRALEHAGDTIAAQALEIAALTKQRDELAASEARYASLQYRDETIATLKTKNEELLVSGMQLWSQSSKRKHEIAALRAKMAEDAEIWGGWTTDLHEGLEAKRREPELKAQIAALREALAEIEAWSRHTRDDLADTVQRMQAIAIAALKDNGEGK